MVLSKYGHYYGHYGSCTLVDYSKQRIDDSRTYKPNSVCTPLGRAGRPFLWAGHCCPALATYPEVMGRVRRNGRPARRASARLPQPCGPGSAPSLFGLAPCGVCPALSITGQAVRSYRTFSPLPFPAVCFLWHFPSSGLDAALPDVIRHTALRSSDFPPRPRAARASTAFAPPERPSGPTVNRDIILD